MPAGIADRPLPPPRSPNVERRQSTSSAPPSRNHLTASSSSARTARFGSSTNRPRRSSPIRPADLIGQPVSRLLPSGRPRRRDDDHYWKKAGGAAAVASRTLVGFRHDGTTVPLRSISACFEHGSTRYTVALILDVTGESRSRGPPGGGREHASRLPAAGRRRRHPARRHRFGSRRRRHRRRPAANRRRAAPRHGGAVALAAGRRAPGRSLQQQRTARLERPFPIASIPLVAAQLKIGKSALFLDAGRPARARSRNVPPPRIPIRSDRAAGGRRPAANRVLSALYLGSTAQDGRGFSRHHRASPADRRRDQPGAARAGPATARCSRRSTSPPPARSRRGGERGAAPRGEGAADLAPDRLGKRGDRAGARADRTGRADARHGAAARRDRNRQGSDGAGDSRPEPAPSAADDPRQLRRDSDALIESELFGREKRRVHRRAVAADRPVRSRQPVHALPRRDRRPADGSPGQAAARAAGAGDRAPGQHPADQGRRPHHRGHQPQPRRRRFATRRSARICSTGSTSSRSSCRRCANGPRTSRRWCGASSTSSRRRSARRSSRFPRRACASCSAISWPGNVRELRNVIERAVIVATGRQLVVAAPRLGERPVPQTAMTLTELEIDHIRAVLESTSWRVRGSGGAAERLGLKPTTLESRMAQAGHRPQGGELDRTGRSAAQTPSEGRTSGVTPRSPPPPRPVRGADLEVRPAARP